MHRLDLNNLLHAQLWEQFDICNGTAVQTMCPRNTARFCLVGTSLHINVALLHQIRLALLTEGLCSTFK